MHTTATNTTATARTSVHFPLDAVGYTNLSELARHTGYPLRTIQRWNTGGIPARSADHLAIRLGLHPANIWPETWWQQP